jgi:hypothetical protein
VLALRLRSMAGDAELRALPSTGMRAGLACWLLPPGEPAAAGGAALSTMYMGGTIRFLRVGRQTPQGERQPSDIQGEKEWTW